jgi:hypothetical protein
MELYTMNENEMAHAKATGARFVRITPTETYKANQAREVVLGFAVTVDNGNDERVLARFAYESDALNFARASFAGDNGGDYTVYDSENGFSAFSMGERWVNISEGARTEGFNG